MPINAGGKVTPAAAAALFSPASAANRVPTSASLGPYSRMAATGDAPRPRVRHAEIERRASAAAPRARHALIQARASAAPLWGAEDDARAGAAGRERGSGRECFFSPLLSQGARRCFVAVVVEGCFSFCLGVHCSLFLFLV
jgi:hypothetical protein